MCNNNYIWILILLLLFCNGGIGCGCGCNQTPTRDTGCGCHDLLAYAFGLKQAAVSKEDIQFYLLIAEQNIQAGL